MKKKTNYDRRNAQPVHPLITAINKANSLEDFKEKIANILDDVRANINNELISGYYYNKELGDYQESEFPLYHAVSKRKSYLVPYLVELGAKEVRDLFLLHHAIIMNSNLTSIQTIYGQGFTSVYRSTLSETDADEIFKYLHQKFYNISILDVARGLTPPSDYLSCLVLDCKETAKPVFLRSIRENHDIKSALKVNFILGLDENPIVTFLKTSKKNSEIKITASYKELKGIIDKHQFIPADIQQWKIQLSKNIDSEEFKPNPALAALYFAHKSPNENDYRLFEKHLMVTNETGYTLVMQDSLKRLLSTNGLSRAELTTLKKNIVGMLRFNSKAYEVIKTQMTDDLESPLKTIVRTIKFSRDEKATKTYRDCQGMGFFASKPRFQGGATAYNYNEQLKTFNQVQTTYSYEKK